MVVTNTLRCIGI